VLQISRTIRAALDAACIEKAVELILIIEAENLPQLIRRNTVFAEGLECSIFQEGARGVLPGRKNSDWRTRPGFRRRLALL
jgi:hypothetical protein